MRSVVRVTLSVFAAVMLVALPARTEAASYTFDQCLVDSGGLCGSLESQLKADGELGLANSTIASDTGFESTIPGLENAGTKTFEDIIEALKATSSDEGFRIASHVQGSESGDLSADKLLAGGAAIASPEPATISLFGLALIAAAYRLRRRPAPSLDPATTSQETEEREE